MECCQISSKRSRVELPPGSVLLISKLLSFCVALVILLASLQAAAQNSSKPRVRALTTFIRIDPANYEPQMRNAITFLCDAKRAYEQHGYAVQTLRITTQPFPEIAHGMSDTQVINFFHALQQLAHADQILLNTGPAMLTDADSNANADLFARVLAENDVVNGSIIVAQEDGVHWNAVHAAAHIIKYLEEHSKQGTFQFAATAMLAPYSPFFPGSYHTGSDRHFSIGLESANLVQQVFAANPGNLAAAEKALGAELARYDQECEQIALAMAKSSGWTYEGLDPTPAPLGQVSIGDAIEKFTGTPFGSSGTMTAAAMITRAVKSVPVKQVGYSGLMVPVLEDSDLARRWSEGAYNVDSLLAYSAVCATGLDTVPLPGDVTKERLARMIGDVATLAYKWKKPLAARLLPVAGKKAGERTSFESPYLSNTVLQKLP
jgi:uncharacterized protein